MYSQGKFLNKLQFINKNYAPSTEKILIVMRKFLVSLNLANLIIGLKNDSRRSSVIQKITKIINKYFL